jgi:heme exporter protein D
MSDYLWDKSGEPEAEVERLEELLGNLRHRPRMLELPADTLRLEPRRPSLFSTSRLPGTPPRFRISRRFGPAWVAVAATLLLACLLFASVFLRTRVTMGDRHTATRDARQSPSQPGTTQQASASTNREPMRVENRSGAGVKRDENEAVKNDGFKNAAVEKAGVKDFTPGGRRSVRLASFPKQQQKLSQATANGARVNDRDAVEAMSASNRGSAPALVESTRLLAKEQLVYALRLTGSKLRQVRRKTQGSEDSRPGFDAPERIKRRSGSFR